MKSAMPLRIPRSGSISAFAMIVDINSFTQLVRTSNDGIVSQFTRDVLRGGVAAVEEEGGEVVGFMGDISGLRRNRKGFR